MLYTHLPYERLHQFLDFLGLDGRQINPLAQWSQTFMPHAEDFARTIETFVMSRPQLRVIHENQEPPNRLLTNWRNWFTRVFTTGPDEDFIASVWRSGQAHVVHNVDHRYVTLAYNIARGFCHDLAGSLLKEAERAEMLTPLDNMIGFSILVETDAFVTYATQCELEVIQGISHQVRNPVFAIGGGARKLLKLHPEDGEARQAAELILAEAVRLERMARSVNTYVEITRTPPQPEPVPLGPILAEAEERARTGHPFAPARISLDISPEASVLSADPAELTTMFACLLENAVQYADQEKPEVTVTSRINPAHAGFAAITITNNGPPFIPEELGQAFSPFHSSQPGATGFGLPMARVIASKYSGNITLAPMGQRGTKCVVVLPMHRPAPEQG